jgi:4-alpha-glucanotransferase
MRLIGDLPFFVSPDSSDVWANPELFLLDERYRPRFVAGVPPDYFSVQGELWGNSHGVERRQSRIRHLLVLPDGGLSYRVDDR